ncbi:energy-coupling factor transporter transmembrane component T [Corynebacterium sp. NPDC060344]|uniref:energy-coupling factor transporter transmembrane component T n=1 Tax=Corynebacterium sp. NPDC060344 TaxID=3347101 RepID=UPI00365BCD27
MTAAIPGIAPELGATRATPDPRTILLAVAVINGTVLGRGAFAGVVAAGILVTVLLATTGRPRALRHAGVFAIAFAAFTALFLMVPTFLASTGAAALVAIGFWCARFAVCIGLGAYAIAVIRPTELTAGLRALRAPNFLVIPLAVVLRIIPVIITEARAIGDAMTLRGLRPGVGSFLAHPVRTGEMALIPLLSTVVRTGDELAASAMIRGLGGPARPTTITRLAFRLSDAAVLAGVIAVVALSFGPGAGAYGIGGTS